MKLQRALESILRCSGVSFEVIVVDQRGDDALERGVNALADTRVVYVRRQQKGRNGAMNHGAKLARGDVIGFTDDDIIVSGHWLQAAHDAFTGPDRPDGVVGRILQYGEPPSPDHLAPQTADWLDRRLLTASGLLKGFGANTFYRREVFKHLGGYDPRMGVGGAAGGSGDWELLYRSVVSRFRILYSPDVIVWHDGWETRESRSRKARQYAKARMAAHIKCWAEVGGPALRDMTSLTVRLLFEGVNHVMHRRRGSAAACFSKCGNYIAGVPLGLRLAWEQHRTINTNDR